MKWTSTLRAYDLDLAAYQRDVKEKLHSEIEMAARAWLYATVVTKIPSWSNASKATFEALARAVGTSITYGPQLSRKNRKPLGLSNGTGGVELKGYTASFYYNTTLRYLAYNEHNVATPGLPPQPFSSLKHSTPYNFLESGQKAFKEFVKTIELPSPYRYLKLG